MRKFKLPVLLLATLTFVASCSTTEEEKYVVKTATEDGYTYEYVTNDDLKVRIYTLENGLKVYMSVNKDEPRIQTAIAVKAGSTYDPPETTGLAHYLEHMVFKGTDRIGTIDWEKEEPLIAEISRLYELHRSTDDSTEKSVIYKKIDSVSTLASKFAISNEYDKMITQLGGKNTNAFTSNEQTVYINNIPTNELEKWLKIERERFGKLVLRLFHTELETVYEEFNAGQDSDGRKVWKAILEGLFPNHPYGTQTTIGVSEHLKNPSMVKINEYFDTYYVPNNIAICLAGDMNPSETIKLIDQYFGDWQRKEVPPYKSIEAGPINGEVVREVIGPDKESIRLVYRFDGKNSQEDKMVTLIDMLLSNRRAGVIDLDLVQKQKILRGGSSPEFLKDYGMHYFYAEPRDGQSLEELKELLLGSIEKIKKGDFGDWLIPAVINDLELSLIEGGESNWVLFRYVDAFIHSIPWIDQVRRMDDIRSITKEEIVKFANEHYKDNYLVVYKRTGKDSTIAKVYKPAITPLELNRVDESEFLKEFAKMQPKRLTPVYLNFEESIKREALSSGIDLNYIENTTNELFGLYYIIDMGSAHNKKLGLAVNYLPYLGTSKYSPAELQEEFYKLGITMGVSTGSRRSYVYISGLERTMVEGMKLLEHVLAEVKADQTAFDDYIDGIIKKRADNKLNKRRILNGGMRNYAIYGSTSAFTDNLSEEELRAIDPNEQVELIKGICDFKHYVFYYGQKKMSEVGKLINEYHTVNTDLLDYPEKKIYLELDFTENKVYFVNYDMVQAEMLMITKDEIFNKDLLPYGRVFGEYFGSGLSSIVFQEIREAKGLAYSAYSYFSSPSLPDRSHYVAAYVGTQADKIMEAVPALIELMQNMPEAQLQFNGAKEAILKIIESERITKRSIFWTYLNNKERGIDYDYRKDIYEKVENMSMKDFKAFFNTHIRKENYTYLLIANKDNIDFEDIGKFGEVKELTLEEIFGY